MLPSRINGQSGGARGDRGRGRVAPALGAAGLLAGCLLGAALALAAAGDLDPSFNGNGKRVIRIPPPPSFDPPLTSEVYGMALHQDGTIALALHFQPPGGTALAVMRLRPDGSTDPSFAAGLATLNLGAATSEAQAVAVQKDGKVLAAGSALFGQSGSQLIVARFNQDGALDTAFGKDGVHFGVFAQGAASAARAVAVQKDGKIVAAGLVASGGMVDFGVARITRSGIPDPGFAGDGEVITDFGGNDQARSVAIQPDGKLVVGGISNAGGEFQFALARYTRSGALDRSFGTGGKVLTDFGDRAFLAGAAIQKDGKIVAAGAVDSVSDNDIGLARYTKRGALDRSFGTGGKVITDLGSEEAAFTVPAIQKDGKIVVAGSRVDSDENFLVVRYQRDGQLDLSFSTDGWTTTDLGGGDYASALGIDGLGRIVAAGTLGIPGVAAQGAVARYLAR